MRAIRASGGTSERSVVVYDDLEAVSSAAAALFAGVARESVALRGRFAVALAGGETPRRAYELVAERYADVVPWSVTDVFFTDERCVPPDDARSNYAMAQRALLARVPIDPAQVHRIPAFGVEPSVAANEYESDLRRYFAGGGDGSRGSTFDLVLLGLGADGHTASLFPGHPAAAEAERWVVAVEARAEVTPRARISLTRPILSAARHVLFLVAGEAKRAAVAAALYPDAKPVGPAAAVSGTASTRWFLDVDASPNPTQEPSICAK